MTDKELLIYWRDDRAGKAEATLNEIKPIIRQLKHFGCFSERADSLIDVIDKILFPIQDEKQEGEIPLVNTSDIDLDHAIHGRRTKIPTPPEPADWENIEFAATSAEVSRDAWLCRALLANKADIGAWWEACRAWAERASTNQDDTTDLRNEMIELVRTAAAADCPGCADLKRRVAELEKDERADGRVPREALRRSLIARKARALAIEPTPPDDHTPVDLSHDEPDPIMDQDTSAPLGKLKKPDEKRTCHLGGGEGSPRNCPACNPTPQPPKEGELVWYGAGHVMDWTYDADDMADITGPVKPNEVVPLRIAIEGLAAIKNGSVWNRYATPQKIAEKALEAIGATVTIERSDDE